MNITIVTGAFNGYGRYLKRFCRFVARMDPQPTEVVAALGKEHGCKNLKQCQSILPILKTVRSRADNIGALHNRSIEATTTEYVMWLDIDDKILPHAIKEFSKYTADYIIPSWYTMGLGLRLRLHCPKLPRQLIHGKGFITHGPFRRWIWEAQPFEEHMYPRYAFIASAVENGATFVKTVRGCFTYLRRADSLNRSITNQGGEESKQALAQKRSMERRLRRYYETAN